MSAAEFFYILSVFSVKVAVVLFYKSIFIISAFQKVANGMLVILGAWIAAFFFVRLSRNWGQVGTTVNFPVLFIVQMVSDTSLDLFILCMPLGVIRTLQTSRKKKWLLCGVFWLGAL